LMIDFDGSGAWSVPFHSPFSDCDITIWDTSNFLGILYASLELELKQISLDND
jgi:hypothetical protein